MENGPQGAAARKKLAEFLTQQKQQLEPPGQLDHWTGGDALSPARPLPVGPRQPGHCSCIDSGACPIMQEAAASTMGRTNKDVAEGRGGVQFIARF